MDSGLVTIIFLMMMALIISAMVGCLEIVQRKLDGYTNMR
jgi:hypothetical protein